MKQPMKYKQKVNAQSSGSRTEGVRVHIPMAMSELMNIKKGDPVDMELQITHDGDIRIIMTKHEE